MKGRREVSMTNPLATSLGTAILATAIFAFAAVAQPQAQSQNPPQEQAQSEPAADSVADAARKAKADKAKTAPKKVYTEDDMSSLKGGGLSVVGQKNSGAVKPGARPAAGDAANATQEAYWRARAQNIRGQMAAVDEEIVKLREEIKKGGGAGFDMQTGRNQSVAFIEDRNTQLKNLQKKKDELQKQMDALEDEGRQAGVPAGWLR